MATFLADWLAEVQPGLKAGTLRGYSDIVEHRLVPHLGDIRLTELRAADISRCYAELRKTGRRDGTGGLSETSIEHSHRCLHAALEHAVRNRLVTSNPADLVIKPRRQHHELTTWTAQQLNTWLDSVKNDRLYPLWLTAATSGCRRGELIGLQWDDVDLGVGQLAIRRSRVAVGYEVVESTPKSGKARTVAVDPQTVAVLKEWRQDQRKERMAFGEGRVDSPYVFTREDGAPLHPHQVADAFDASVRRAKVPTVRFHDLRHGWATMALQAGVNPKVVSERLGHATTAFTLDKYAHVLPGTQAAAAATVAGLVFGEGGAG
jgi:integrase